MAEFSRSRPSSLRRCRVVRRTSAATAVRSASLERPAQCDSRARVSSRRAPMRGQPVIVAGRAVVSETACCGAVRLVLVAPPAVAVVAVYYLAGRRRGVGSWGRRRGSSVEGEGWGSVGCDRHSAQIGRVQQVYYGAGGVEGVQVHARGARVEDGLEQSDAGVQPAPVGLLGVGADSRWASSSGGTGTPVSSTMRRSRRGLVSGSRPGTIGMCTPAARAACTNRL